MSTVEPGAVPFNYLEVDMHSIWTLSGGLMRFLQKEDGVSFIECALVGFIVAVVSGIAFLAIRKQ